MRDNTPQRGRKPFELPDPTGGLAHASIPYSEAMHLFERAYLRHALRSNKNLTEAARVLGLSRTTLYRHIKRLRSGAVPEGRRRQR